MNLSNIMTIFTQTKKGQQKMYYLIGQTMEWTSQTI